MTADTRTQLLDLYRAAIVGADVTSRTAAAVQRIPLEVRQRVWVFSFGKAADAMAAAAMGPIQRSLAQIAGGVIVAPTEGATRVGPMERLVGDHPIPGPRSFAASRAISRVMTQKRRADLGVVLISGGASSLIASTLRGLEDRDLTALFERLLASGLDIHRMNAIRKRFSYWAAGRMALALAPARTYCFAVSDVIGDDLASIGSGPCTPDPLTVQHIIELLRQEKLFDKISPAFRDYLTDVSRNLLPETPKPTHPAFAHVTAAVVANNAAALEGAAAAARAAGLETFVHNEPVQGDAAVAGRKIAETLTAARASAGSEQCHIWGGETVVALADAKRPGGRCQELALSAAQSFAAAGSAADGIALLAGGTDGRDGTTDAAGAIVDLATWGAIASRGGNPANMLRDHDAHTALASVDALFSAGGATGTNVMDLMIARLSPKAAP